MLFGEMVRARLKTICFCSVRKICELTLDYARQHLRATEGAEAAAAVGAYRGGLTPVDRRRIERQLYDGTLRGVTATSSLELGVDIANLDGVVMVGFPGSLSSMWQRAGRCGRSASSDALCIVIAYPSAIDQWAMRHPKRLLAMKVEDAVVDTANPVVLRQHLLCAASEQPITADEVGAYFDVREGVGAKDGDGDGGEDEVDSTMPGLDCLRSLHQSGKLVALPAVRGVAPSFRCDVLIERPETLVNIRSIDQSRVQVIMQCSRKRSQPTIAESLSGAGAGLAGSHGAGSDGTSSMGAAAAAEDAMEVYEEVVDEVEQWRCWYELYEGAIYLNQGRKLEVTSWEVFSGIVRVRPSNVRYYTGCLDKISVVVLQRYRTCALHLKANPKEADAAGERADGAEDAAAEVPPMSQPASLSSSQPASLSSSQPALLSSSQPAGPLQPSGVGSVAGAVEDPVAVAEQAGAAAVAGVLGQLCLGKVRVTLDVAGFVKRWQKTGEIFEEVPLSMPSNVYNTRACWIDLPEAAGGALAASGLDMDAGLHAAAHARLAVLPLRLSCEPGDASCECDALRKRRLWPKRLLIFDRMEGGLGISDRAHRSMMPMLADALRLMRDCPCRDGCYCCVHTSKCPEYNATTDKRAAIAIIEIILAAAARPPSAAAAAAAEAAASAVTAAAAAKKRFSGGLEGADSSSREGAGENGLDSERFAGDDLPRSMLGASIRRLWNLAPAGAEEAVRAARASEAAASQGAQVHGNDGHAQQCSDCDDEEGATTWDNEPRLPRDKVEERV